jgi:hypothetical protein
MGSEPGMQMKRPFLALGCHNALFAFVRVGFPGLVQRATNRRMKAELANQNGAGREEFQILTRFKTHNT